MGVGGTGAPDQLQGNNNDSNDNNTDSAQGGDEQCRRAARALVQLLADQPPLAVTVSPFEDIGDNHEDDHDLVRGVREGVAPQPPTDKAKRQGPGKAPGQGLGPMPVPLAPKTPPIVGGGGGAASSSGGGVSINLIMY